MPAETQAIQSTDDQLAQLQKLGELYQSGVLSAEEFAAMKAKILQ
ncbi:MAG: SHOCT domain-containing protein [Caldilinea sp.]|nr:SHOCT domain-containing protein [Caldilinea sp.]